MVADSYDVDCNDCPIPNTHRRLDDVHQAWHEAAQDYFDPKSFRRRLNQLLQEARNVTFMLQSEKSSIPGFEEWYSGWQGRMRDDPTMTWLQQSRTQVTKRGDLETRSTAQAAVVTSWTRRLISRAEVPPMMPMDQIVAMFTASLPAEAQKEGLLMVDRRWVDHALPGHELLDALAHCYGVLSQIVAEAHERCGSTYALHKIASDGSAQPSTGPEDRRLPCMVASAESRQVLIHLRSGEQLEVISREHHSEESELEAARQRYEFSPHEAAPGFKGSDDFLASFGRETLELGKRFLARDGYHLPFVWLALPVAARS